jgi:microsomal dipeptidase-like Zn-dependent dipeptidase
MNSFLWDRDLRRHYWTGKTFDPLASLTDFKMLEKGDVRVLWSSLHIPERQYFDCRLIRMAAHLFRGGRKLLKLNAWECLLAMMEKMEWQVARTDRFRLVRSNAELTAALRGGKTAILHTLEGGHVLGAGLAADDLDGRLGRLERLADRGVASLTLAHLFPNDLAGHAEAIPAAQRTFPICPLDTGVDLDLGLTETGHAVVEKAVDLRIVPDVTHCTPVARQDVYRRVANRIPIIASHTGVQSMNPEPYNLDESDVRAIADSGGVVGVIFMPHWLETSDPGPGLDAIWHTMETVNDWSGGSWRHVAIGTDFDGFTDPPDDCKSAADLPAVPDMLEKKGLSAAQVEAVAGTNARRVLSDGWR